MDKPPKLYKPPSSTLHTRTSPSLPSRHSPFTYRSSHRGHRGSRHHCRCPSLHEKEARNTISYPVHRICSRTGVRTWSNTAHTVRIQRSENQSDSSVDPSHGSCRFQKFLEVRIVPVWWNLRSSHYGTPVAFMRPHWCCN